MSYPHIGIWVDHHKAVVVKFDTLGKATISELDSTVSSKHRSTGGVGSSQPFLHRSVFSGKHQAEHRLNDLHKFYENVAAQISNTERVWIFGPSTARYELLHYLKENGFSDRFFDESEAFASHASQAQIIEHIKEHFHKLPPRQYPITAGQPQRQV